MGERQPLVFAIKGHALDDGPGIRSVIFFKGCPFACLWCHNPEGKRPQLELAFEAGECVRCDTCLAACPEHALDRANPFFIDRRRCTLCMRCVQSCPSGALRQVGKTMTVDEIASVVLRDQLFYENSGGGVTLSGGEPTLCMEFAGQLARRLKAHGLHVLLETCGLFSPNAFDQLLYPWLDQIYFDLKLIDSQAHARYCGAPNDLVLENFRRLAQRGAPLLARIPLIPGITDTEHNLRLSAAFLQQCGATRVALLPYHPLWQEKNLALGIPRQAAAGALDGWLNRAQVASCAAIFEQAGVVVL